MNRWTHPVQFMQQTMDRHQAYITELQKITAKLKEEVKRLDKEKANKRRQKELKAVK